jgi:hypothetical protein
MWSSLLNSQAFDGYAETKGDPTEKSYEVDMSENHGVNLPAHDLKVGFWSSLAYAVLLIALNISFVIMAVETSATAWEGMEAYSRTYQTIAFLPQVIGLASIPALILMLASIHVHASEARKIWSMAGLAFGSAFAILLGSLYFIQVAIILPALKNGRWEGLDLFTFANPRSLAWGLNHFAWSLLGAAFLSTAWVFEGGGRKHWIRWFFSLNGLANISLIFSFTFDIGTLTLIVAFSSWVIALPLAAFLVALMFRKELKSAASSNSIPHSLGGSI